MSRRRRSAWTSCSTTAAPSSTRTASSTCPGAASCDTASPPTTAPAARTRCWPQFQATDPATGKPYSDDFGWLSHTYDTPYLDVGCATQDYIEAELNENTTDVDAPHRGIDAGHRRSRACPRPSPSGHRRRQRPTATYNPQVFVPGNHSGFADLDPGTPATVDPPDLDEADASTTGGTLAAGTYEYAVTDQFNGADSTSTDQSQAYVTDGQQGDLAPVTVTGSTGSVSLVWQSICHAANYIIYRAAGARTRRTWTEIGTYATPDSATLPDNSSGDSSPASTATVCQGPTPRPHLLRRRAGAHLHRHRVDTATPPAGVTYLDTPMPAGWTPPVVENANELPWEQNPYFNPALDGGRDHHGRGRRLQGLPQPARRPVRHRRHLQRGRRTPPASPSSTAPPRWRPGTRSTSSTTPPPTPRSSTSTTPCTTLDRPGLPVPEHRDDHVLDDAVHLPAGHQPGRLRHDAEHAVQQPRGRATSTRPT